MNNPNRQIAQQLAARHMRLTSLDDPIGCWITIDLGTRYCRVYARSDWSIGLVDGCAVIVPA